MAYVKDLQPCSALAGEWRDLLAVGWLAKGREFATGPVDPEVVRLLSGLRPWDPPGASGGSHACEFCSELEGPRVGRGTLFVPGKDGVLYVAPRLITHYVRKHGYQPPTVFLDAVRASPTGVAGAAVTEHLIGYVDSNPAGLAIIEVLEGLEPVRLRPRMYLGSTGAQGIERMLSTVLDIFVREHLAGTSTCLSVDVNDQGWITVEDDGRGLSIEGPVKPEVLFGWLMTQLPEEPAARGYPVTHGPIPTNGIPVATALSARLEVETRRDGTAWRLEYACGLVARELTNSGMTSQRGTVVRLLPDDEVFELGARLDLDAVERRLRSLALLCPKLDVRFQGRSLAKPDGLASWFREVAPELVKETLLSTSGTVGEFDVEVAFAWRPRASAPLVRSFVNYEETPEGGAHVRGLIVAIENVIGAKRASRTKKVVSGLVGIVHVGTKWPSTQRGLPLDDKNARDAVRDVVTRAINEAPWWWDKLHTAIG